MLRLTPIVDADRPTGGATADIVGAQLGSELVLDLVTGAVAVMAGALAIATFRSGKATRQSVAEAANAGQ